MGFKTVGDSCLIDQLEQVCGHTSALSTVESRAIGLGNSFKATTNLGVRGSCAGLVPLMLCIWMGLGE